MSGRSAVDAFTIGRPRWSKHAMRKASCGRILLHDGGEPWQRGVNVVRDREFAEQLQRAVDICTLKIPSVGNAFFHGQHRDSPPCLRRFWSVTRAATTSVRAHSSAHKRWCDGFDRVCCDDSVGALPTTCKGGLETTRQGGLRGPFRVRRSGLSGRRDYFLRTGDVDALPSEEPGID